MGVARGAVKATVDERGGAQKDRRFVSPDGRRIEDVAQHDFLDEDEHRRHDADGEYDAAMVQQPAKQSRFGYRLLPVRHRRVLIVFLHSSGMRRRSHAAAARPVGRYGYLIRPFCFR